jgi:hypothetical protein
MSAAVRRNSFRIIYNASGCASAEAEEVSEAAIKAPRMNGRVCASVEGPRETI